MAKRHLNTLGSFESVFLRLEELVLANSGADEFDEVFKLVIAKLWDEKSHDGKRFHAYGTELETYDAVTSLLREAGRHWIGVVEAFETPLLTPEHLAICVEALSKHKIFNSGLEVIDGFFEFTIAKSAKSSKGQFFTPRHVIEMCVRMVAPQQNESVLDPACGSGGFLFHTLDYMRRNEHLDDRQIIDYCKDRLWGFDIDGRAVKVAKALMILAGDGNSNIFRVNSLLMPNKEQTLWSSRSSQDSILSIEDVVRTRIRNHGGFDIIVTNPPFAGEIREKSVLDNYWVARGKLRVERDLLFVERCIDLLRPGGRIAVVLPHNKFASDSFGFLREWIIKQARILGVVSLGRHTFLPHTHQKASVLFAQKRHVKRTESDENIFFAVSEMDGKNSKGQWNWKSLNNNTGHLWDDVAHDLGEIEHGFADFCKKEGISMGGSHGGLRG
ncbi:MAG: N-6 DNA methylase [Pyrinomonadaceae bacterium]